MTRNEILTHIHNHPKMLHLLASIYQHKDYTWVKESGLNASACLFIDNNEHDGDLVVTTGAGDRSPGSHFLKSHNKYYHPNELTPEKIDQIIADDEQNLFVSRFKSFSFDEIPQFMYGLRNIPPRSIQMQFSHKSRCYINVTKDINKRCFKYEVKYEKTAIKTFYDCGDVGDFCWNLHISYRDNPDLVIKKLKTEKRESLAAGDFE